MKGKTAYKIIAEKELIVEYYTGEITVDDFIALKDHISKVPQYSFSFKALLDLREADLKMNEKDLQKLIDYLYTKFKGSEGRQVAYLTKSPNDVVQSYLYTHLVEAKNILKMHLGTFSTLQAAVKWFGKEVFDEALLSTTITQLKKSC